MKKTTVKSTSKSAAPKAAIKPVAAKSVAAKPAAAKPAAVKITAPKKAAATVKPAAPAVKPVAPAVKPVATAKVEKTPAPKVKSVPVSTTIVAAVDVGFGNTLSLRGEGAGLSWELGLTLDCAADDRWSITLPETTHPIICKFLINDEVWSAGEDYTVLPGSSVVLSPAF